MKNLTAEQYDIISISRGYNKIHDAAQNAWESMSILFRTLYAESVPQDDMNKLTEAANIISDIRRAHDEMNAAKYIINHLEKTYNEHK